jgi:antitoxin (DNA-binding transcriptional repressor) of toxin-antitoxin stability system
MRQKMSSYPVGELKSNFSSIIRRVQAGEEIEILYGKRKEAVAKIIPISKTPVKRTLGILEKKAKFIIGGEWEMTAEELFPDTRS